MIKASPTATQAIATHPDVLQAWEEAIERNTAAWRRLAGETAKTMGIVEKAATRTTNLLAPCVLLALIAATSPPAGVHRNINLPRLFSQTSSQQHYRPLAGGKRKGYAMRW